MNYTIQITCIKILVCKIVIQIQKHDFKQEAGRITSQSQSYLKTDGQTTSPSWCQASICDLLPFFLSFLFKLSWHVRRFQYRVPSLTRGWVCNLWLLLGFTSAVCLGLESRGTHDHTLPSQLWDSCIFYPRNNVAQLNFQVLNLINLHVIIWQVYLHMYTYMCWASLSPGLLQLICPIKCNSGYDGIVFIFTVICFTAV
jgi:hypothetical protein